MSLYGRSWGGHSGYVRTSFATSFLLSCGPSSDPGCVPNLPLFSNVVKLSISLIELLMQSLGKKYLQDD